MMTMDRPAGIERALGGSIAIQYRDATVGFSGTGLLEICMQQFAGSLLLVLSPSNVSIWTVICMQWATKTGVLLSGHPFNTNAAFSLDQNLNSVLVTRGLHARTANARLGINLRGGRYLRVTYPNT